jgi:hypothetical protein
MSDGLTSISQGKTCIAHREGRTSSFIAKWLGTELQVYKIGYCSELAVEGSLNCEGITGAHREGAVRERIHRIRPLLYRG